MKKPYYNQEIRNEIKEGETLRANQIKVFLAWHFLCKELKARFFRKKKKPNQSPAFIQWKGTDVCLDFWCKCGAHNHYDGYFAYRIVCGQCKTKYELNPNIEVTIAKDQTLDALEPEHCCIN